MDHYKCLGDNLSEKIRRLIEVGMEGRISQVVVSTEKYGEWQVEEEEVASRLGEMKNSISLSLFLKWEDSIKKIEMGPPANNTSLAQQFRSLWGEKSELRRFKDGSIVECVLWDFPPSLSHLIPKSILSYLLSYHFSFTHLNFLLSQLEYTLLPLLPPPPSSSSSSSSLLEEGRESWRRGQDQIQNAFESLKEILLSLPLPLKIINLFAFSPLFTQPFYPLSSQQTDIVCQQSIKVGFEMEASSRWPSDPLAIEKIKTSFYLQIAHLFNQSSSLPHSSAQATQHSLFININHTIFHLTSLYKFNKQQLNLLQFRNNLVSLFHFKFPSFSETVRYAKR